MTPSYCFQKLKQVWKHQYTITIIATFLFGLIAHAYKFFNLLPNYDSLNSLYSSQNTIHLGRCFLTLGCGISSYYDLSWIIGLLSLVYIAVSAICITELFDLKSTITIVLCSGLLVTFPAVTNTFAFLFTADGYFLAMLLSSLAVLLICRSPKGFVPAVFFFCLSLGMYQAYILYAGVLTLLYGIKKLLFDQITFSDLCRKLLRVLGACAAGTVLYYVICQILLKLEHASLSSMNGISEISIHNLPSVIDALYNSLHDFIFFFFYSNKGLSFYVLLNILFSVALILLTILLIFKSKKSLNILQILSIALLALAIPFCIYFYYFVSQVQYHTIMLESIALIYIFLLIFLEHPEHYKRFSASIQWFLIILCSLIIYNFTLTANIAYTNMAHSFERSTAVINRMAARMEALDDFHNADKLAVIGELSGSNETIYNYPPDLSGTVPNYIMRIPENYVYMLQNYNDIELAEAKKTELAQLIRTPEYQNMSAWPAESSIQIIDHYVVIKLSEPTKKYDKSN